MATALVWVIFGLTYLFLAWGRVPGLRLDRAGIALIGAAALIGTRQLDVAGAAAAVDVNTITLLFGMMVVVTFLRLGGLFDLTTAWIARRVHGPRTMLAALILLAGGLSAFLVNDVVCLALTPLVVDLCKRLRLPPVPYLLGLATAANIGSTATPTGNPQNMIIGSLSGLSYGRFFSRLGPVAVGGLVIAYLVISVVYRRSLAEAGGHGREAGNGLPPSPSTDAHERLEQVHVPLWWPLAVTAVAVLLFFAGWPPAAVALGAAAVLLLSRVDPHRVYRGIDWSLLVMFMGLFVVVHVFEVTVVSHWGIASWSALLDSPVVLVSCASVALSNLVSNVPAVLLFEPVMRAMHDPHLAWLALAMSSTLAGNLTLLGSVANLIVAEGARRAGCRLTFGDYLKVGVPLTIVTTSLGVLWLTWAGG